MTFLQDWALYALPLVMLPIVIHLINQRRYRTVDWAATHFLLQARRMTRGLARLRFWLILLARMLAVAGLIFAVGRPMAGGWLWLTTGGIPELVIVIVDRSPTQEHMATSVGMTRRERTLTRLAALMERCEQHCRVVVFDGADGTRYDVRSADELPGLPFTQPSDAACDLPAVLQQVADFIRAEDAGRADVWICTDRQRTTWDPDSARWEQIAAQLRDRAGLQWSVFAGEPADAGEAADSADAADSPAANLSVCVGGVRRRVTGTGAELVMEITIACGVPVSEPIDVPLAITIDGARSALDGRLTGSEATVAEHRVPIDDQSLRGWGRVELPRDANPADNTWHFVYAEPPVRSAVIVSDALEIARVLQLVAETPVDRGLRHTAIVTTPAAVASVPLDDVGLLIWQAPLPTTDSQATILEQFASAGRSILFFPPEHTGGGSVFNATWGDWEQPEADVFAVSRWTTDQDLLRQTQSGQPLPVAELGVRRCRSLQSQSAQVLAQLASGPPLLTRVLTDAGGVWFCGTLPTAESSGLLTQGVTLYVIVQRALAEGMAVLNAAQQRDCGPDPEASAADWVPLESRSRSVPPSQRLLRSGVYRADDRLLALNRPESEDDPQRLPDAVLLGCLEGLDATVIASSDAGDVALASEVWRVFLMVMIGALLAEAILCLPHRDVARSEPRRFAFTGRGRS